MWYNCLSEYLLKKGYKNDPICPYIFIKWSKSEFAIIDVHIDDLNIIKTRKEHLEVLECLKREFGMKDRGITNFCLDLQIENLSNEILVHQSTYTEKDIKTFLHG